MSYFTIFGRPIDAEPKRCRVLLLPHQSDDVKRFRPTVVDQQGSYGVAFAEGPQTPLFRCLYLIYDADGRSAIAWNETPRLKPFSGIPEETTEQTEKKKRVLQALFGTRYDQLDPSLIIALDNAYRYPGDLVTFAKQDSASLIACLSHFVFEVDAEAFAKVNGGGDGVVTWSFDDDPPEKAPTSEDADLEWATDQDIDVRLLEVEVEQKAAGLYFILKDLAGHRPFSPGFDTNDVGERRILVRRSVGPVPGDVMPVYAEILPAEAVISNDGGSTTATPTYDVHDALAVTDLVGEQIHYRLEVINAHRQVMATGSVTVLRERLDTPTAPTAVLAKMKVRHDAPPALELQVSVAVPADEDPSRLRIDILADERELDETGLYGDDDDLSLTEGLREADLTTDAAETDGDSTTNAIPDQALERLKGRFEWDGLIRVTTGAYPAGFPLTSLEIVDVEESPPAEEQAQSDDKAASQDVSGRVTYRIDLTDGLDDWMKAMRGWRLYAGIARETLSQGDRRSRLITATHQQDIAAAGTDEAGPDPLNVFQLERFDLTAPARRFIKGQDLDVELFDRGTGAPLAAHAGDTPGTRASAEGPAMKGPADLAITFTHRRIASDDPTTGAADDEQAEGESLPDTIALARVDDFVYGPAASDDLIEATAKLPVGAYRIWRREPLGLLDHPGSTPGDSEQDVRREGNQQAIIRAAREPDFELETDVLVLPPLVAAYRPVDIGAAKPWRVIRRGGGDTPTVNEWSADAVEATRLATMRSALDDAENALLNDPDVRVRRSSRSDPVDPDNDKSADAASNESEVKTYLSVNLTEDDQPFHESWRLIGRLVSTLRAQDLTRDLLVRQSSLADAWPRIEELTRIDKRFRTVKVLMTETFDGEPMATIRLVAIPWGQTATSAGWNFLPDPGPARSAIEAFFTGPRLLRLRDQDTDPLRLTLKALRRVEWSYRGLEDSWHHDVEWVIEALDRYHQIRTTIRTNLEGEAPDEDGATEGTVDRAPRLEAESAPDEARQRVAVPRLAPLKDRLSVTPAAIARRTTIAFRVSDTVERLNATWNALARARLGRIQSHLRTHRTFTRYDTYDATEVLTPMTADWVQALGRAKEAFATSAELQWSADAGATTEWCGYYEVPAPVRDPEKVEVLPLPYTDLVRLENTQYYFTYGMTTWLTADYAVGPASTAELERRPGRLGLVLPARFGVTAASQTRYDLRFEVIPPLLGSHLTPAELAEADRSPRLTLNDYPLADGDGTPRQGSPEVPAGTTTFDASEEPTLIDMPAFEMAPPGDPVATNRALPLHLLPDLEIEIMVYIDIGLRRRDGTARSRRILPLFQLAGPNAAAGGDPDGFPTAPVEGAYKVGWRTLAQSIVDTEAPRTIELVDGRLVATCRILRTSDTKKALDELIDLPAGTATSRLTVALKRRELVTSRMSCLAL